MTQEFLPDHLQLWISREHWCLEVVRVLHRLTARNGLSAETLNFIGFIGGRQPGIGFRRRNCKPRIYEKQPISDLILKFCDLVSSPGPNSASSKHKERYV